MWVHGLDDFHVSSILAHSDQLVTSSELSVLIRGEEWEAWNFSSCGYDSRALLDFSPTAWCLSAEFLSADEVAIITREISN